MNEKQIDVVLYNDDKVSFDFAIFVLTKVFEHSKETALEIAKTIDRAGKAVVFTGDVGVAQEKLDALTLYNEATDNALKAEMAAVGSVVVPAASDTTSGFSVTLGFNKYVFERQETKALLSEAVGSGKLNISSGDAVRMLDDLAEGREVVLKDFGDDPKGAAKAQALRDVIGDRWGLSDPSEDQEYVGNISLNVREGSYKLTQTKLVSADDKENQEILGAIGGFVHDLKDMFVKDIEKNYGTVENFLKSAPQDKIDEYAQVMEQVKKMDDISSTKKPTP